MARVASSAMTDFYSNMTSCEQLPTVTLEGLRNLMAEFPMPPVDPWFVVPSVVEFDSDEIDNLLFRYRVRMDYGPMVADFRAIIKPPELSTPRDWTDSIISRTDDGLIAEACELAWMIYAAYSLKEIQ